MGDSGFERVPRRAPGCDMRGDQDGPVYQVGVDGDGAPVLGCRCIVCARCGHHTGNSTQGHYWRLCTRSGQLEKFHLCCPDDCELAPAGGQVMVGFDGSGDAVPVMFTGGAAGRVTVLWPQETVHACPLDGVAVTTCCGRTLFDLPRTDRVTDDMGQVTCGG